MRQTGTTGLGSHLFWPGFHIRMNVHIQVNENPRKKLQPLSKKTEFIWSDFLEQSGAREIPIWIKRGQRNFKYLRCLLVGHSSEIPQFDQLCLIGILDAKHVKHLVHGQQLIMLSTSSFLWPSRMVAARCGLRDVDVVNYAEAVVINRQDFLDKIFGPRCLVQVGRPTIGFSLVARVRAAINVVPAQAA
jgi:hypothetical protein